MAQKIALIVEDYPDWAEMMADLLVDAGIEVVRFATTVHDAREAMLAERPDIVLLDGNIEGLEPAVEVLHFMLRQYPPGEAPPVIGMSAEAGPLELYRHEQFSGFVKATFNKLELKPDEMVLLVRRLVSDGEKEGPP